MGVNFFSLAKNGGPLLAGWVHSLGLSQEGKSQTRWVHFWQNNLYPWAQCAKDGLSREIWSAVKTGPPKPNMSIKFGPPAIIYGPPTSRYW